MESFDKINGIAAPIPEINIDTDAIIPKQFLKTIERKGLGKYLFYDRRFDQEGKKNNSFILNRKPWDKSSVIVAGDNFGCGSSREHAPWALLDFGIKCVISSSFADIFYNNSFKNGLLPIVIDKDNLEKLMEFSKNGENISVNLKDQIIISHNSIFKFNIDSFRKHCLLNGLDDIGITMEKSNLIDNYEKKINNKSWNIPDTQNTNL